MFIIPAIKQARITTSTTMTGRIIFSFIFVLYLALLMFYPDLFVYDFPKDSPIYIVPKIENVFSAML